MKMSNITQKWVDVLLPFSADYSARLSASEISRRTGLPQQTVSRQLNEVSKLSLLDYKREGKNKLFYFDLKKQSTKLLLGQIEIFKSIRFLHENKEIAPVIDELLQKCKVLVVFGSYASGTFNKESDLDILFLGKCDKKQISAIKRKQVLEINEHYSSYTDFSKTLKLGNALAKEILQNHIIFGDISGVVGIFLKENE
jgi:predicted nucleotidyltransferase